MAPAAPVCYTGFPAPRNDAMRLALTCVLALFAATAAAADAPAEATADGDAGNADRLALVEFTLAAAAEPGDARSDRLLAETLGQQLRIDAGEGVLDLPAPVRARVSEEQARLQARADAARDDDPVLLSQWLCCQWRPHDPAARARARARLAELDGDNAHSALVSMTSAWTDGDNAGFAAAAARGARATRYQTHYPALFASLRARFRAVPDSAVPALPSQVFGIDRGTALAMSGHIAFAGPPYQWFLQPCRQASGKLLRDCLAIARWMVRSDALLDASIGASLLQARGDDADQALAQATRREFSWLMQQSVALTDAEGAYGEPGGTEYFDAFARGGERAAMRALLAARNLPTEPPADWTEPAASP